MNAETTVSASPQVVTAQPVTIGTCDTAGPIEVESTGGTTAPTAYATLKAAFDAIIAGTHTGSINIEVCGNTTETATAALTASGLASTSYTDVTIRPVGGARIIEGSIVGAIIRLNGADNVTIDGRQGGAGNARDLTVRNNSTSAATAAIWLSSVAAGNGAANDTIRNLEIAAGANMTASDNSTFGIIMSGTAISTTTNGVDNDNNSFIANRIIRARYGIVTRGTTTDLNINPIVTDNIVGPAAFGADQIGKTGIFMQADTGALVSRNTVQFVGCLNANTCTGADRLGIAIGSEAWSATASTTLTSNTYTVTKNNIHDVVDEKTFSSVGIEMATTGGGSPTNNLVANNFVYNVRANGTSGDQPVSIGYVGGHTDRVVFNSISMTGDMDPAASSATTYGAAIRVSNTSGSTHANLTMANNSIYLDATSNTTATIRYYAISLPSATYSFGTGFLNYNNYYINPSNTQLRTGSVGTGTGGSNTTEFATLANWQAALTPAQDANSKQADPLYFSNTSDLHIQGTSPNIEMATAVAGVTDDIDTQVRPNGALPDIGADEFYASPGTVQLSSATYSVTELAGTATITVTRTGGSSGAVSVNYATSNGTATGGAACGAGVDYVNASGTLNWADGDSAPKTFNITVCNDGIQEGSETVNITLSSPTGGVTIGTPSSAVLTILNSAVISGSVNVGTSETFTSLTNPGGLFEAINTGAVTANTTINITTDLTAETGTVALNEFSGGFTLTIQPSGGARLISGNNATALLNFNGADGVTITGLTGTNNLTIRNTGTGAAILYINDSSNNIVTKTTLEAGANSSVLFISTGITTGNDNITVDGNVIRDRTDAAGVPFNSINVIGSSTTVSNSNILINNNQILNFLQAGIVIGTSDNITFTFNDIFQSASRTTSLFGVAVNSAAGTNLFSQNTIHDLTTTLNTTGMAFNDSRSTTVSRNNIFNFPSTSASTGTLTGILSNGSSGNPASLTIVNNMVSIIPSFTNAQNIFGIRDFGFAGNTFSSYFNSVLIGGTNTAAGTTNSWACQRGFSAPTAYTSIDNICFNNRTGGTGNHFAAGDQSQGTGTFVSDYNIYVGTGATAANFFDLSTSSTAVPVSFATWQAGPPTRDANSQASNPGGNYTVANIFLAQNDLHLNTSGTNPALNAGIAAGGVTNDFDGQTRPSGSAPEIGADEIVPVVVTNVQFNSATYTGAEGTSATITVTRTGDTTGASSVNYATSDGTATGGASCGAGVDYQTASGTLNFAAGETSKTFNVTLCSDAVIKGDETVNLTLSAPTGATLGTPSTAVLTITNVNPPVPGTLALSSATYSIGEAGGNVTITVNRTGGSDGAVAVNYGLSDGTATGGAACGGTVDYVNTGGTVNFANGETSKTFNVAICNDATLEANETFNVTLSGATGGATIGSPSSAVVTILDDETAQPGVLALSSATYTVGEAGGTVTITVNRTGGSDGAVSVNYGLSDGTATGGAACGGTVDYVNTGGTVNFANGETSKTFTVAICNDSAVEGNETFNVTLSGATGGATIGSPASAVVTITDDDTAQPGTLAFSSATYTVGESGGTVTVTVNRTGGSDGSVTVNYATSNGTATGGAACGAGVDYVNASGTLTFANGVTSQTFTVTICNDAVFEPSETVNLALTNATGGATIGSPSTAVLTITDDDTPPSGNVLVNPGNVTYNTLKEAFDAINAGTHTGAVTVDIIGNTTETASAVLNASGSGSANYTSVAIAPSGGARTVEGTIVGAVIKLNGADNVTIDGRIGGAGRNLTVRNNSSATATAAIWLASVAAGNGASNNVVRNLEIAAGQTANLGTNTTIGILMAGTTVSLTADGTDNDNNQFVANRIIRARYGIVTRGTATNNNEGLVINDNIVGPASFGGDEIGKVGIFLQADTGATVSRNTVQYVGGDLANTTAGADRCGICIGGESWGVTESGVITSGDYTVTKNNVHDVIEERTFSSVGIRLGTTRAGVATNNLVANNFIYNVRANGTLGDQVAGIGYAAGHTDRIVFNSISLTGDQDPGAAAVSSIYGNGLRVSTVNGTNNANLTMTNNSVYLDVNSNTAANHFYTITLPAATYSFGTGSLNYNNYYFNPANPQLRTGGVGVTSGNTPGAEFLTLADWQAALTPPQDANSKQADPLYFSPTGDLHIFNTSPNIDMGTPVTGITDDIDSQVRPNGAAPDIGADEFYAGAGTVQFSSSTYSATEASGLATITVTRSGGATGAVSVNYATSNGTATGGASCGAGVDYVSTSGTLTWANNDVAPKTFTVTICNDGIFKGSETVNLTLSNPTGGATLGTPSTAVLTIIDSSTFSGSVNVGTGETVTSLTNPGGLFEALNNGTVNGNLTVNITSDLTGESGSIALNQFAAGFTVTIKPSGAARTITGTGSGLSVMKFNGADNVVIDGSLSGGTDRSLTVVNPNPSTGAAVIWFASASTTNGATNNTVKNTITRGSSPSTTLIGIVSSSGAVLGGVAEAANSNNTYQNNLAQMTQYGIALVGPTGNENGNVITQNEIGSTTAANKVGFNGIAVFQQASATVSNNTITGVVTTGTATTSGIRVAGTANGISINANKISDVKNTNASGFGSNGIQLNSSVTTANVTVSNNFIWDVASVGFNGQAVADNGYGIVAVTGGGYNIYFNSVHLTTNQTAATGITAALNITSGITTAGAVNVRNNILSNQETVGTRFAIANNSTVGAAVFAAINYNDYFSSQHVGFQTTNRTTLADWQTATGQDANSKAVDPLFISATNLHLQATSPLVDMGTPIAGITTDIDGQTRDALPEIGADELAPNVNGTLVLSSATYTVGESDGTVTVTVNRTGGTTGAVSVNYTLTNGTATGGAACGAGVDYVNTGGTVNFADGQASQTFTVAICNDTLDEANETFNVTLSGATGGATIGTPSTAVVTITDDDASPSLSINDVSQTEGNGTDSIFLFTVTLSQASGQAVTVDYATANGTATAGSDYVATNGTLNFAAGETTKQIMVTVIGDLVVEANETFFVNLTNATNSTISDNQGLGTILNDDAGLGTLSINDVRVTEGNSGTTTATFTVTLIPGSGSDPVTVQYATANGTATAGSDYVATSGTLTFASGETTKTITVTINGDTLKEANETFFVNLSSPTNATITDNQGVGIIIDNDRAYVADFDHDRKSDYSVWRPSDGYWYILQSTNNVATYKKFGTDGDKPVPGDYDADGVTDLAVFRPSEGNWYIQRSSDFTFVQQQWGLGTDKLVQGDYDGDGRTDIAVFRDGLWFVRPSSGSAFTVQFGSAGDVPVQGDYDGDAKTDFAVFRGGNWYVLQSSNGAFVAQQWGLGTDKPIVGDFDGDGSADFTVYRDGTWYILGSLTDSFRAVSFGVTSDIPVPGDFDGDGTSDVAVFRPSSGFWFVIRSSDGTFAAQQWGQNNDVPIPAAYQSR